MIKQAEVSKSPGIYKILNVLTGDCYVGSSMNVYKRMYQHQTLLRNNRHHAPHLQHAWNKYGQAYFEYMVLEYVDTDNEVELRRIEQGYLDRLCPVYNVSKDALSPLSTKYSPRKKSHTDRILPQNRGNWNEIKFKISKTVKSLWNDSEYRKSQIECMNSDDAKLNYSKSMKTRYKDSTYKSRVRASILRGFASGNNRSSKLSKEDVLLIREMASKGASLRDLEIHFNSSKRVIWRIVTRRTWDFL